MANGIIKKATTASLVTLVAGSMAMPMTAFAEDNVTPTTPEQETTPETTQGDEDAPELATEAMVKNDTPDADGDVTYTAQFFKELKIGTGDQVSDVTKDANANFLTFKESVLTGDEGGHATFTFFETDPEVDEVEYTYDEANWTKGEVTEETTDYDGYSIHTISTPYTTELANGSTFTLTINEEYYLRGCWDVNVIDPETDETIATFDVAQNGGLLQNVLDNVEGYYFDKELTEPVPDNNYLDYAPEDTNAALNLYVKYVEGADQEDVTPVASDVKSSDALPQTGDLGIIGAVIAGVVAIAAGVLALVRRKMMQ